MASDPFRHAAVLPLFKILRQARSQGQASRVKWRSGQTVAVEITSQECMEQIAVNSNSISVLLNLYIKDTKPEPNNNCRNFPEIHI